MRKNYLLLLLFTSFCFLNAQSNYYYYYNGQKKDLTLHKKSFNIFTNDNFQTSSTANIGVEDYVLVEDANSENTKFAQVELITEPNTTTAYNQKLNELKQLPNVDYVGLFFENGDAEPVGISKNFYVKLKNVNDYSVLQQIALQKNVEILKQVPYMPKWYIIEVASGNTKSSLELGNQFYETGLFDAVDPAFMLHFSNGDEIEIEESNNLIPYNGNNTQLICSNDTNFNLLWGLKNTTNPAIDINACQAWNISQGLNINVAVVDQGIRMSHPDLLNQFSSTGYDAKSGIGPSVYIQGNTHGTEVAGVIGALRNNKQVVGVAPKSKIIPISHNLKNDIIEGIQTATSFSAQLASGISYAWQIENADIINNSWYSEPGWLDSELLEDAIIDAIEYGREGKGCLVVFASGNNGHTTSYNVLYPANFDDRIMSVGGMTKPGARWYKSSYGAKLDVVAPGHGVWTTTAIDGIIEEAGTSLAAPHVSGIAALILSVNPCLTGQQVRDIIEQTSQKVGNYSYATIAGRPNGTWNNEMGYGLVDAHAAVLMARNLLSTNPCAQGIQETPQLSTLEIIAPNPAINNVSVNYILRQATSASLMIVSQTNNYPTNTYNLDLNATQTIISVNNYLPGLYTVA